MFLTVFFGTCLAILVASQTPAQPKVHSLIAQIYPEEYYVPASSCAELQQAGQTESGTYRVYPRAWTNSAPFDVYCDLETDGGGWTVIQRRLPTSSERNENFFFRKWNEYRRGFGNVGDREEFWLGNDYLYVLTLQGSNSLRVELEDWDGSQRFAQYSTFSVGSRENSFMLSIAGYSGDAGDGFNYYANGAPFGTYEKNDCARKVKGGWWHSGYSWACQGVLNGIYYYEDVTNRTDGVIYAGNSGFRGGLYSLKKSEMKIRPSNFNKCSKIGKNY